MHFFFGVHPCENYRKDRTRLSTSYPGHVCSNFSFSCLNLIWSGVEQKRNTKPETSFGFCAPFCSVCHNKVRRSKREKRSVEPCPKGQLSARSLARLSFVFRAQSEQKMHKQAKRLPTLWFLVIPLPCFCLNSKRWVFSLSFLLSEKKREKDTTKKESGFQALKKSHDWWFCLTPIRASFQQFFRYPHYFAVVLVRCHEFFWCVKLHLTYFTHVQRALLLCNLFFCV